MSGPSDTTKPFYTGDNVKITFKIIQATRHLDVQPPNGEHIDIDGKHFVEVKYHEGKALFTRRPFQVSPTYEQVFNAVLSGDTYDDATVAVGRLFGLDLKPTMRSDTDDDYEHYGDRD
jgi:hypothetical protein